MNPLFEFYKLLVLLGCFASSQCIPTEFLFSKIYGGQKVGPKEFPWIARILFEGQFICAASILTEDWLLTCGHCVIDLNPEKLSIVTGDRDTHTIEGTEHYHKAFRVISHPAYSERPIINDIAVIRVYPPMVFDEYISTIRLPPFDFPEQDSAVLAGWGYTEQQTSSDSTSLSKAIVPIVNIDECIKRYTDVGSHAYVNGSNICGEKNGGCKGDSGGALVASDQYQNPTLYGIVSFGTHCGDGEHPGVFARVSSHLEFIHKYLKPKKTTHSNLGKRNINLVSLHTMVILIVLVHFSICMCTKNKY